MKSWLQNNYIEIYSARNDGKTVVAEIFIRTLKKRFMNISLQYEKWVY